MATAGFLRRTVISTCCYTSRATTPSPRRTNMRIADSSLLERASKALVLASLLGALVLPLWSAKGEGRSLPLLALAGAIAAYLFGRRWPERTAALVLAAGYLTPVASFLA